ncbi:ATP-dependent RNA helicase dbp6 [Marasmius tenuissimus]|uniref:ATP-dependent RNA helicase n=1 Tax=Marasmius tenuissimus TaxID=585030 RepID=A0ABR2ZVB9_9AGAR
MEAAPKEISKTKAKQRYLRRKKERRKHRKQAQPKAGEKTGVVEHDSDNESEEEDVEEPAQVMEVDEREPAVPSFTEDTPQKTEKRPKKRRKLSEDAEEITTNDPAPSRSPSPVAAFPSFPLPTLPDAPTESALALQGLDQALIDAEVVDPAVVQSMSDSNEQGDAGACLSEEMRKRLHDLGITELFAVQTALLPFLLPSNPWQKALYQPYDPPRDICVSAPTGSGKTLAYAIPIIEILSTRIVTRLRALIVLPTRDLVTQVRETFEAIGKGRGLKIGTATGQHSFAHEQSQLVIDEADRLLAQSYQDWLIRILAATRPPKASAHHVLEDLLGTSSPDEHSCNYPDALNPAFMHLLPYPEFPSFISEKKEGSCQKLLFSATLTRDPAKLASLEFRDPKYFVVHRRPEQQNHDIENSVLDVATERFTFPDTLKEHMVICETAKKPLVLFHLVHQYHISNALIFTKSAESTARLVHLFDFFEKSQSSSFFANHYSYDAPVDMRKYVHRVGRTARAGKEGDAWTLVEEQEARYFKTMMKNASHLEKIKRERVRGRILNRLFRITRMLWVS